MDNLVYRYDSGNKLTDVKDTGNKNYGFKDVSVPVNDYAYDKNGNMIRDVNKGISGITYNHLNLPREITIGTKKIAYTYDATGNKLEKKVYKYASIPSTTIYAGNYIYTKPPAARGKTTKTTLAFFNHAEGYVTPSNTGKFDYIYQYKDHLGNVRLSYADTDNSGSINPNTEIIEESNYYPFGLKHKGYNNVTSSNGNSVANKFKYNGKELNEELGLDWYDYGARNYDAALGRWHSKDNKAEFYFANSPYVYALNTPINAIDPDGNLVIFINGLGGGGANYWRNYDTTKDNWLSQPNKVAFDLRVSDHFNDHKRRYYDGSPGSLFHNISASNRYKDGYAKGKAEAASIIESLARDPQGNIIETIKIVTHSMGGVYGKGFVKALKKYIKNHKDPRVRKALISVVADFDPFQAGSKYGKADSDIFTQQFIHEGFWDFLGFGGLANQEEEGADDKQNDEKKSSHFIETFVGDISQLQEGTYEWDKDKEQWICTSCKKD